MIHCTMITLIAAVAALPPRVSLVPAPPRYVESSIGLNSPHWDGGRTMLQLADLNLDGNPDIVTVGDHGSPNVNTDMHGITVWFGDGTGRWAASQSGNFGYGGVAVGDINNDGLPDVGWGVHHNYGSNGFGDRVMGAALGDGTGVNWTPWDQGLGVDGQTWGMFGTVFADVNVDGLLDIASVSFGCCDGFHVYLNNGDGTWTRSFGFLGGNSNMDIATGDVNDDGYPDFAVAQQTGTIYLGDGQGGFVLGDANLPAGGSTGWRGVALGDVNGDAFDDLSLVNSAGGVDVYLQAPGSTQWIRSSNGLPATGSWQATKLADMDGDGITDLVAFGNGRLAVWRFDGDHTWTGVATFTVPNPGDYAAMVVGDATHNGRPDIAIVSDEGGPFNSRNVLRFFRERTEPRVPTIQITSPVRYRTIREGAAVSIDWLSAVPQGVGSTVRLELSEDGADGPWILLGDNLPNNGHFQVNLQVQNYSGNAFVRASVRGAGEFRSQTQGPYSILP